MLTPRILIYTCIADKDEERIRSENKPRVMSELVKRANLRLPFAVYAARVMKQLALIALEDIGPNP